MQCHVCGPDTTVAGEACGDCKDKASAARRAAKPVQRRLCQSYALVYAGMLVPMQNIGRRLGYAIAVHGSMATDLDVVAVPWVEGAAPPEELVKEIAAWFGAVFQTVPKGTTNPTTKPHGRTAYTMQFDPESAVALGGPYLDISVYAPNPLDTSVEIEALKTEVLKGRYRGADDFRRMSLEIIELQARLKRWEDGTGSKPA